MTTETCNHQHCGQPIVKGEARYKSGKAFHAACSYAHPDYDVRQGCGSPFTTITRKEV